MIWTFTCYKVGFCDVGGSVGKTTGCGLDELTPVPARSMRFWVRFKESLENTGHFVCDRPTARPPACYNDKTTGPISTKLGIVDLHKI